MVHKNTKKITVYAMCISLAFLLSYLEAMLPVSGMVPGMKLGLTNLIVLFALYYLGHRAAFFVNVVRILLVALTYGTMVSFCFSLAGGMASFFVMWLLKKTGWFQLRWNNSGNIWCLITENGLKHGQMGKAGGLVFINKNKMQYEIMKPD